MGVTRLIGLSSSQKGMLAVLLFFYRNAPLGHYLQNHNVEGKVLSDLREMSMALTKGRMTSTAEVGRLLTCLCRAINAKKVIDVGVFTGISSFSMALALPEDGKVIACDVSEENTNLGRPYWVQGEVSGKIDLRIKPATETLQELIDAGESETFDAMFIDADKTNYPRYFELGMQLLRHGGVFIVDNALWYGRVADPAIQDKETTGVREINYFMRDNPSVEHVLLDTSDGIGLGIKL